MKKLNEFNVGDTVTNFVGEVFEIKAINKTGSVKIYVKQTEEFFLDVVGNEIKPEKTYTVNIPDEYEFELLNPEENIRKNLNEFNVGDVVTNDDGEVFVIQVVNKTGSVKVFVLECDECGYTDVVGNEIKPEKTYTLNLSCSVFRLVEVEDKSVDISVGEMYRFYHSVDYWTTGIVVYIDSPEFVVVDSFFDIHEYTPDEFLKIVHIETLEEKIIAKAVARFFNEEFQD